MRRLRHLRRTALTVMTMVALTLGITPSVLAGAPERISFSFSEDGVLDCGSFQDQYTDFYTVDGQVFRDADGTPTSVMLHYEHHSDDTNSVTGLTLHEHGHYLVVIDLVAGTITTTGTQGTATRPGSGVVVNPTGRRVYTLDDIRLFFAGARQHNPSLGGDQVYCDALR